MPVNENIGGIQVNISADTKALDESLSKAKGKVTSWITDQRRRKIELTVSAKINETSVTAVRNQLTAIRQEFAGPNNKLPITLTTTFKVTRATLSALQTDLNNLTKTYPIKVNVTPVTDGKNLPTIPVKGKFMGWVGDTPTVGVFAEVKGDAKGAGGNGAAALATSFSKDADRIVKAINDCCAMGSKRAPEEAAEPAARGPSQRTQQQQQAQQAQNDRRREETQRRWDERRERRRVEADNRAAQTAARSQQARTTQKSAARETGKAVAEEIKETPVQTTKAPKEKAEEKAQAAPKSAAAPAAAATPKPVGSGFQKCPDCGANINMSGLAWQDHRKRRHGEGQPMAGQPDAPSARQPKPSRADLQAAERSVAAYEQEANKGRRSGKSREDLEARRIAVYTELKERQQEYDKAVALNPPKAKTSAPVEALAAAAPIVISTEGMPPTPGGDKERRLIAEGKMAPHADPLAAFAAARAAETGGGATMVPGGGVPTAEELGAEAMARATPPEAVAPPTRSDAKSKVCSYCGRIFSSPASRKRHEQIHQRESAAASAESEQQGRATQARANVGGRGIPKDDAEMAAAVDMVYKKGIFEEMPFGEDEDLQARLGRLGKAGVDLNRLATEGILGPQEGQEETFKGHPEVEAFQRDLDKAYDARRDYLKEALAAELSIRPEAPGKRTNIKAEALRQAIEDPTAGYAEQIAAKGSRADMLAELGISEESRSGFNMRALKAAVGGTGLPDFIAGTGIQGFDPGAEVEIPTSGGKTTTIGELRKRNEKRYEELQRKYEDQLEEEGKASRMTVRGETKMVPRSDIRLAERYRQGGKWNFGAGVQQLTEDFGKAQTNEDYELVARQAFRMSAEQRRLYSGFDVSKMQRDIEKRGIDFEGLAPEAQSDFMGQYKINDKREQGRRRKRFRQLFSEDFPRGSDTEFGLTGLDLGAVQTRGVGEISDVILALTAEVKKNTDQASDSAKATMSPSRGPHGEEVPYLPPEKRPSERMVREEISERAERSRREKESIERARIEAEANVRAGRQPYETTPRAVPEVSYAIARGEQDLTPAEISANIRREHEERLVRAREYLGQRAARVGRNPQQMAAAPEAMGEESELLQAIRMAAARVQAPIRSPEAQAALDAQARRARTKAAEDAEDAGKRPEYRPFVPPPRKAEKGFGYAGYYNPEAQIPAEMQEQFLSSMFGPAAPMPQGAGGPMGFAAKAKPVQTRHCDVCNKDIATSHWSQHTASAGHRQRGKATQQPEATGPAQATTVSEGEVNAFIKNLRAAQKRGEDVGEIPSGQEAREYLERFKQRVNVGAPEGDMPFSDAGADTIPPNKVRGMGGGKGGPIHVWVDNWPKGFTAGSGLNEAEIKRMARQDPEFAKRMVDQGVLGKDFAKSARSKVRPETTEEEQAEEAAKAAKRKGAPTRSQIAKEIGQVEFGKTRGDAQDAYEDMLDVVQDQQNFAREVLEENPVRALSVAVSQVAVNLTGRAELKNAITAINRSARRATRFATDANDAMVNLQGAQKAFADAPDEDKAKWDEAVQTYQGEFEEASKSYERVAGIPFELAQRISQTTDPQQRQALVREAERTALAREPNAQVPETLFGRTARLREQRPAILARTALVGTAGIVGGTFLFTAAMAAFNAAMEQGGEWVNRLTNEMTGFAAAANDLAKSLGQSALVTGRTEGGVRERFGQAGIGGATAEALLGPVETRVRGEVQAQRAILMRDTMALGMQGLAAQQRGVENFAGNFQPTGGLVLPLIGQTNIMATPSVQETMAGITGGLPSNTILDALTSRRNPITDLQNFIGGRDYPEGGLPEEQLARDSANLVLGGYTDALRRGGSTASFVNPQMEGIKDQDALTRQAEALVAGGGSPDLAQRIFSGDLALIDANGQLITSVEGVSAAFDALGEGMGKPDLEQIMKSGARQMEAAFYGIARNLQIQLQQMGPIQTFQQLNAQPLAPFGTGINLAAATQGLGLAGMGAAGGANVQLRQQLLSRAARGATAGAQMVGEFGPQAGVSMQQYASTLEQINTVGQQIVSWQTQISEMQLGQRMAEYNRQVFVAQRNIEDLQGLVHGVGDEHDRNIGLMQRENLMHQRRIQDIQREGEAESLAMNQRQINFNRALANFTSSGATPAEAAARAREAELQAEYAQRQQDRQVEVFDITGEMIPNERKIVDETNLRALEDAIAEFDLFQSRFTMDEASRVLAENIAMAQQLQQGLNQDMQAMLGALQQAQQVETSMVQDAFTRGSDTLRDTAKVVSDVYAQVAADFHRDFSGTLSFTKGPAGQQTSGTGDDGLHESDSGTGGGYASGGLFNTSGTTNLTVGEAGTETVAVLRNPRQMNWGGGGGTNVQVVFNSPVIRNDSDITKLALAVEEVMNRRARLYGVAR